MSCINWKLANVLAKISILSIANWSENGTKNMSDEMSVVPGIEMEKEEKPNEREKRNLMRERREN